MTASNGVGVGHLARIIKFSTLAQAELAGGLCARSPAVTGAVEGPVLRSLRLAYHVRPGVVKARVDRAGLDARAEVVDVGRAAEWRAAKPAWAGRRTRRLAGVPDQAGGREDGADPRARRKLLNRPRSGGQVKRLGDMVALRVEQGEHHAAPIRARVRVDPGGAVAHRDHATGRPRLHAGAGTEVQARAAARPRGHRAVGARIGDAAVRDAMHPDWRGRERLLDREVLAVGGKADEEVIAVGVRSARGYGAEVRQQPVAG